MLVNECFFCEGGGCPSCNDTGEHKLIYHKPRLHIPIRQARIDAEAEQDTHNRPTPDIFDEKRAEIERDMRESKKRKREAQLRREVEENADDAQDHSAALASGTE